MIFFQRIQIGLLMSFLAFHVVLSDIKTERLREIIAIIDLEKADRIEENGVCIRRCGRYLDEVEISTPTYIYTKTEGELLEYLNEREKQERRGKE